MKKTILILVISFLLPYVAYASSGKTVLPLVCGKAGQRTDVYLTNITSNDLVITAKAYYDDGTEAPNIINYYSGFTNTNELQANHRALLLIQNATQCATLEIYWNNKGTDHNYYGLIGEAMFYNNSATYLSMIRVNNGLPF